MLNTNTFQQSIHQLDEDYKKKKFLLAVSGGVDSMVLLHLFQISEIKFEVAHVNYKLRGQDSTEDQRLVEEFCTSTKIHFHLYVVSAKDHKPQNSIQDWARNLRYDFFRRIVSEQNLDLIATAHHLNDNLETFIIHLSKASGIKGLSGIPRNDNGIIRPLLNFSKEEIYEFAKSNKVEFREDLSNRENDYLRNKIRNEIVPKFLEINERFLENFSKSIRYLTQTKDFVEQKIEKIENDVISKTENYSIINKEQFLKQSDFTQFEILHKFGFSEVEEIQKINKAETGKRFFSKTHHLIVDRDTLILKEIHDEKTIIEKEEIVLTLNSKNIVVFPKEIISGIEKVGNLDWEIDLGKLQLPLKLRKRKEGDIFHPIRMIGKKKISKFFKDEKIPILAQQKIWLLCDDNDHVVGILPYRQDRRFAATKDSTEILKLKSGQAE